jgi:hypothetical protein
MVEPNDEPFLYQVYTSTRQEGLDRRDGDTLEADPWRFDVFLSKTIYLGRWAIIREISPTP